MFAQSIPSIMFKLLYPLALLILKLFMQIDYIISTKFQVSFSLAPIRQPSLHQIATLLLNLHTPQPFLLNPKISPSLTSPFPPQPATPLCTSGLTCTYHAQALRSSSSVLSTCAQEPYKRSRAFSNIARLFSFSAVIAVADFFLGGSLESSDGAGEAKALRM